MHQFCPVSQSTESFLSGTASHVVLPDGLRSQLLSLTQNQAVLLGEFVDGDLRRLSSQYSGSLGQLTALRDLALRVLGRSSDPRRYLPFEVSQVALHSQLPWHEFARLVRPPTWSWVEVLAAHGPVSPAGIGVLFEMVFQESKFFAKSSLATFAQRAVHSGCDYLVPKWSADESVTEGAWSDPPAKRLKVLAANSGHAHVQEVPIDARLWRFRGHLALELALRSSLLAIQKSWKSYRSGLYAWSTLTCAVFPHFDPFSVNLEMVSVFSSQFRNSDTFREYMGHVKLVLRLLGREVQIPQSQWSQLLRGLGKRRQRLQLPRLLQNDVERLVDFAIAEGRPDFARFFVLARVFLFRVRNELFGLQLHGQSTARPGSIDWHSEVEFHSSKVVIHLRTRKNAPEGATLVRRCSCKDGPDVMCPLHALLGQRADMPVGAARSQPVWDFSWSEVDRFLRRAVLVLQLGPARWHAFRRGMAQDLLDSGSSLSYILRAGGWRSGAILRYLTRSSLDDREALEFTVNDSDSDAEA